ncbi:hypothetical protein [Sediminicola luteus]|uniref:Uncharacterized protein n=1 Tax=Sediminicola luteus TaxID=319238 RepID=A0ABV2TYG8_9FLAO
MKALNTKERNATILKFAAWLFGCVLLISVPFIFSSFVAAEQQNIKNNELENQLKIKNNELKEQLKTHNQEMEKLQSIRDGNKEKLIADEDFERNYMAVKIQNIIDLMGKKDSANIDPDSFNAELTNIFTDINNQTEIDTTWRGDMYRNTVTISKFLISANKIVSSSGEDKEDMVSDLNDIIVEIEGSKDDLADLSNQKKRKDLQNGINSIKRQLQKSIKKLNNFKSGIK